MMIKSRHRSEASARFEERRKRERGAARLRSHVPSLSTLRLAITESNGTTHDGPKHARIVVVETSPALFVLGCGEPSCRDGGHDLTSSVMSGLLEGQLHFEVDQMCDGTVGTAACGRNMHVNVTATYDSR